MRNVAVVTSGTAIAQAIAIAFAPILTRIFEPEAFGVLGTFTAIIAVVSPIAALSYPMAIVLPANDADARGLARLSVSIACGTTTLTALALLLFQEPLVRLLRLQSVATFVYLIPIVMLASVCLDVAIQWAMRKKLFSIRAKVASAQALLMNCARIGAGWFAPTAATLVIVSVLGSVAHAAMLTLSLRAEGGGLYRSQATWPAMLKLAERHRDFPLYRAPQILINAVSLGLPVLLLASLFGPVPAGFYTLGRTVLVLPATLVAQSVGEVFYPRISEAANAGENLSRLIRKATLGLTFIGLAPFAAIAVVGPNVFAFAFGDEWRTAGLYASWLSIMLFFNFINRPCVAAVPVLGIQRGLVVYEALSTAAKLLALYLGFVTFDSDVKAIALFSIFGAFAYVVLITWIYLTALDRDRRNKDVPKTSR